MSVSRPDGEVSGAMVEADDGWGDREKGSDRKVYCLFTLVASVS